MIEDDNLYVQCKVYMQDQVLELPVDLDIYPNIKKGLSDVFNLKCSLADLARKLESDLVIFEVAPKKFKLSFKQHANNVSVSKLKDLS